MYTKMCVLCTDRTGIVTIYGNTLIMKLWYQESAKLDITGVITKYGSTEIMNFWYQESVKLGRTGTATE
jgi:hypothetical protein